MASRRTQARLIQVHGATGVGRRPGHLVVEEPLEVRLDGRVVANTMRTPGHDFELAAGRCFGDGLLGGHPIVGCRYCSDCGSGADTSFNVVSVDTGGRAPVDGARRPDGAPGACGWGAQGAVEDLVLQMAPLSGPSFPLEVLATIPDQVGAHRNRSVPVGSVHLAALVDPRGAPVVVREDVDRRNAVDKVVGRRVLDAHLDQTAPARGLALFLAGRVSFDVVERAWRAGTGAVLTMGVPSSLAVRAAEAAGMVLAGWAGDGQVDVYADGDPTKVARTLR